MGLPEASYPVLAIDLGTINVKVSLFDVVSGQYRLIAAAQATGGPYSREYDFYTPIFHAIKSIESQTGRTLLDQIGRLLAPLPSEGAGAGRVVITGSTGPPMRVMLVGVLPEVSLESAAHLVALNYGEIVHQIGLHNHLPVGEQVDKSAGAKPDLILMCGGSDLGCEKSQRKNIEFVRLFCSLIPEHERPMVLYAGSQTHAQMASETLAKLTKIRTAPNLRPRQDIENLNPAQRVMQELTAEYRQSQSETLGYFGKFCADAPISSAHSFGRTVRYLDKVLDQENGVIGINIGTESTIIAASTRGLFNMRVLPYGMGERLADVADGEFSSSLKKWLPPRFSKNKIRDYLWQKSLYPGTVPADSDSLLIEQAAAKVFISLAKAELDETFSNPEPGYGMIIAGGSVIADAPSLDQSLLMLLDGLEPAGISRIYLDPYSIMSSMGAASLSDPLLAVQVLDSFLSESLADVISPASWAPSGMRILTIQVEDGEEIQHMIHVNKGDIMRLPVPPGQVVTLHVKAGLHTTLHPYHNLRRMSFKVRGGMLGVVIDGRGRPLRLPPSPIQRWKQIHKWNDALQG